MDSGINEGPVVDDAPDTAVEGVHELTVDAPPAGHEPAHGDVVVAAPTVAPAAAPDPDALVVKKKVVKKKKAGRLGKRPVFRIFQVTHRWFSLVLGLLLLAIVISGVALLYKQQIHAVLHPSLYKATKTEQPVGFAKAFEAASAVKDFKPTGAQLSSDGLYYVMDDNSKTALIDAGTGHLNGTMNTQKGVFGLLDNLHECGLTCEGYTWYVPFLNKPINWWIFGTELTWGALILGSMGLLLGFMVISGFIVWWPSLKSFANGFRIRRKTNRYKFNYDLHKVVGIVGLPFLAVWALTGAGFELPFVKNVWYAVLPGSAPVDPPEFESKPAKGVPAKQQEKVSMETAIANATKAIGGGQIVYVSKPDPTNAKAGWYLYFAKGNDPYDHGEYPGNVGVDVDQYSGAAKPGYGYHDTNTVAEDLWEHWNYPLHAGIPVNGWWRLFWVLFGITPVVLAVTGVTTWWIRRGKAKRKKRMKKERAAAKAALGAIG